MARTTYRPQFNAKFMLEVLSGEEELGSIAHKELDQSEYAAGMETGVSGQSQDGL